MMQFSQLILILLVLGATSAVQAQTPFYEGKNILLVSGTDAGGAGDLRTRSDSAS